MNSQYKTEQLLKSVFENEGLAFSCSLDGDEVTKEYHETKNEKIRGELSFLNDQE